MPELTSLHAPTDNRVVRVFISSTFRDMQAERDILIKKIFPQLRKLCEERAVTWTEVDLRWGITTEQAAEGRVLPLCLEEIHRCRPYFIGLLGDRYGWVPEPNSIGADLLESQPWLKEHLRHSVTELEILHSVFREEPMHRHAYFYFRDPKYLESVPEDRRHAFLPESAEAAQKLAALKQKIRGARDGHICELRENYANPEQLGEWILEDFTKLIDRLYPKEQTPEPLDQDAARHEAYARSRRLAFVGREDLLRRLHEHVTTGGGPLVLTGESGCGKSALLAEWVARWRKDQSDDLVVQHYIGSTPASADWQGLVRRVLSELKRAFAITEDIPLQPEDLRGALDKWTAKAAGPGRVVLVIDALNQLAGDGAAQQLGWLPVDFPANFCMVVSALPGESLDALRKRGWAELNVPLFATADIAPAAVAYFKIFSKILPQDIMAMLESTSSARNALYLRAVLDELRQFGKHEELKAKAAGYLSARDLPELFDRILARWHEDFGEHADHPDLVRRSLCLIACARFGLAETELLDLLGNDGVPLARRTWTPLYLAVENALAQRAGLLTLGHEYLRAAVQKRYLPTEEVRRSWHSRLATYFEPEPFRQASYFFREAGKGDTEAERSTLLGDMGDALVTLSLLGGPPPKHHMDEFMWQCEQSGDWTLLAASLTNLLFLEMAWAHNRFDVLHFWQSIEQHSPYRAQEAYRPRLARASPEDPGYSVVSRLLTELCRFDAVRDIQQSLEEHYRSCQDESKLVALLNEEAAVLGRSQSSASAAWAKLLEAEQLARKAGDEAQLSDCIGNQGIALYERGELGQALDKFRAQEEICRRIGKKKGLANSLGCQSMVLQGWNRLDEALERSQQQEIICREEGQLANLSSCLGNQASILDDLDRVKEAEQIYQKQQDLCRHIGRVDGLTTSYINHAAMLAKTGALDRAMVLSRQAEELSRKHQLEEQEAVSVIQQCAVLDLLERSDEALIRCAAARELCVRYQRFDLLVKALGVEIDVLLSREDLDGAYSLLTQQINTAREKGYRKELASGLVRLGRLLAHWHGHDRALDAFQEAEAVSREAGTPGIPSLADALIGQAVAFLFHKNDPRAAEGKLAGAEAFAGRGILSSRVEGTIEELRRHLTGG